jgi:hypothetical protein
MKIDEVFGDRYDFLFLFEHSNCTFRVEKPPTCNWGLISI